MRRILFLGNSQTESLLALYRAFARQSRSEHTAFLSPEAAQSAEAQRALDEADIVVEQVLYENTAAGQPGGTPAGRRIAVPAVSGGYLWPNGGEPHPFNPQPPWFGPGGPYGAEYGDAFLNRMILQRVDPADAVAQYLAQDVAAERQIGALFEAAQRRQRALDAATGFAIADMIERHLPEEALFLSPSCPTGRLLAALAEALFARLDVPADEIALMQRALANRQPPEAELPLHPAVAAHFQLAYAPPERRYRFFNEGRFTFEQFALRYMGCAWNAALHEGRALARCGRLADAETLLRAAVASAPNCPAALVGLAGVLGRTQRANEAAELAARAVAIDPGDATLHAALAAALRQTGRAAQAERELRLAAALAPFEPSHGAALAQFLRDSGAATEAIVVAWHGLVCAPLADELQFELGQALEVAGDEDEAERSYRAASAEPYRAQAAAALAKLLSRQGRSPAADTAAPPEGAEATAWPKVPQADPLEPAWRAVAAQPGHLPSRLALAAALMKQGALRAAEREFRVAAAIAPNSSHVHNELGFLLGELGQLEAAVAERRLAVQLEALNPHRHIQLSHTLVKAGLIGEAEAEIRAAIGLAPEHADFRADLARLLLSSRRAPAAVHPAREAVRLAPKNASFQFLLASACQQAGLSGEALQALDTAAQYGASEAHTAPLRSQIQKDIAAGKRPLPLAGEPEETAPVAVPEDSAPDAEPAEAAEAPLDLPPRELVLHFESLGGAGHGCEFGIFQRMCGAEPLGLLRWADLSVDFLIGALESEFAGVGSPEETIVFQHEGSGEWWTRDKRFWMAMRSFVKVAEMPYEKMVKTACSRLQFLRRKLIEDLRDARKIFVYRNMFRDLTDTEVERLVTAMRRYGPATLLCLKYASPGAPPGTVRIAAPGLMFGYVEHFSFSPQNEQIGSVEGMFLTICQKALRLRENAAAATAGA